MPSGRPSGTLFSAQSLLWVSLPVSFALPGRVEAENWSPRGPKGVSGGPRKSPQIDSKSLSVPIGRLRRAGEYPPGACGTPGVHIYVCIYANSYIFMQMYACSFIFIHNYATFMHILCICMHIHAYLCIFVYIHAYVWCRGSTYTLNIKLCTIGLNLNCSKIITGTINIFSDAVPEWPHGTVAGSALCAYIYIYNYLFS